MKLDLVCKQLINLWNKTESVQTTQKIVKESALETANNSMNIKFILQTWILNLSYKRVKKHYQLM